MHAVWYRQTWALVVCAVIGFAFFAIPAVALVMSPGRATVVTGVLFIPFGLFLGLRSLRVATAANHHGFAMHTLGHSRFVPWCHVADLRIGQVKGSGNANTVTMHCAVATLTDGKRVDIAPGLATPAQTVKSERRLHARVDALHRLRAGHQCLGRCVQERWYFGHHAPSTRAVIPA
ncbi:hypothetical protein GCM10023205_56670 [Yinghuangia aomiensis]|uniref:PH domain-containing protein n=1 Tax=Yinghuangia aomiensis TaxID=676205 RepID=A0ABP9HW58_9ACTN